MEEITEEQREALQKIKERIQDVTTPRCDDSFLIRFLRSRKFDLEKTEKKIREALEFFEKTKADTILNGEYKPPKLLVDYFPYFKLPGTAKDGSPLAVFHIGNCDFLGMIKSVPKEELIKYKVYLMEKLNLQLRNHDLSKLVSVKATFIVDLKNLSSRQLNRDCISLYGEFSQIEERYYPEVVQRAIIIQAPRIFPAAFNLVKGFVDPDTKKKLVIAGSDWSKALKEYILEENLPKSYGGPVEVEASWGGKIPKEFYKSNDDSFTIAQVKAGKKFEVEIQVEREGYELSWEFSTDHHDIAFGLVMKQGEEFLQLLETERAESHIGSVEGNFLCEKKGTYVLQWDNSFSWTKSKTLRYKFDLVDSSQDLNQIKD